MVAPRQIATGDISPFLRPLQSERWVPIGFRGRGAPSGGTYDSANTFVMDQQAYQAPAWGQVTSIKLVYAGFDMDIYGEIQRGPTATIKASVLNKATSLYTIATNAAATSGATTLSFAAANGAGLRPGMSVSGTGIATNTSVTAATPTFNAGGVLQSVTVTLSAATTAAITSGQSFNFNYGVTPVTFGGQPTGTLVPRNDYLVSDEVGVTLNPNQLWYPRSYASLSAPGIVLQAGANDVQVSGDASQRTTAANDLTIGFATPSNTGSGYFGPVVALAKVSTAVPSVLALGDSITFGTGDNTADAFGHIGWFQRSVTNQIAWMSMARIGSFATYNKRSMAGQLAALKLAYFSDVIVGWARNDLASSFSASAVQQSVATVAAPFLAAGKRVWVVTVPPTTTSTDNWTTTANQTISNAYEANRLTYNADIRANWKSYGYAGLIDIASVVEDPANLGKWLVGSGGVAYTGDGVHPSGAAVTAIVAAGICTPQMFQPAN